MWLEIGTSSSWSRGTSAEAMSSRGRSPGRSASSIHSVARREGGAVSHHSCRWGRCRMAGAARLASITA